MQTKQIKTGEVYAYGKHGYSPVLAVAMGPYYLAAPPGRRYGGPIDPNLHGYALTEDSKAGGVAVLEADRDTRKALDALLDANGGQWPENVAEIEQARAHVVETLKLFQTGERIELDRLDVPQGWTWVVSGPINIQDRYAPFRESYLADRERQLKRQEAAEQLEERNLVRGNVVANVLRIRGLLDAKETLEWEGYGRTLRSSKDPAILVPVSILEQLIDIIEGK
jgi:hypothetical protein